LGELKQKGNKIVHAWAIEGEIDADAIKSNTFAVQWPPNSGQWRYFPEVDRAGWFTVAEARKKLLPGQAAFIDRLLASLKDARPAGDP